MSGIVNGSWEMVYDPNYRSSASGSTYRMAVPSGWLYRVTTKGDNYKGIGDAHALCFVPDPKAPHVTGIGVVTPSEPDADREPLSRTPPEPYDPYDPDVGGLPYRGGRS